MKKMLLQLFLISIVLIAQGLAAQRHWVGSGTGSAIQWNKTGNWSATQGGAGGAGVPTASDDVFIDGSGDLLINTNAVCSSYNQSASLGVKTFANNATLTVGTGGFQISAGTLTVGGNSNALTIQGNVTLTGGALVINGTAPSLSVTGNWTQSGGTFTATTGSVALNGSSAQTVSGASPFNDLTVNNAAGVSLGSALTVNGILTLTNGVVSTSSNAVILSSTGSVTRTSGWVNGNLQKQVPTGATSRTFEIGDAVRYTPASVVFGNVTTAGNLLASTTGSEHPNITNSKTDAAKNVNRYWSFTNGGVVFTTYSATFNFVAGDIDAGANTASFIVDRFNGSTWSAPTTGTRTATSTQATGLTSFSDFVVGEQKIITITASAGSNGSISPSGSTVVTYGGSQGYTITAASNYHINDVLVDGGSVGAVPNYTFTNVTASHTISANFSIDTHTLTVNATNGSVVKNPDQAAYDHGSSVDLTATPATGYHFVDWSGDATGSANPLTVTMDGNKSITANFAINTYTLDVTATNGSVAKNPDQANYNHGSSVDLTATASPGYHFVDWSGDATGSANPLTVTMDGNKSITANFAINTYTLDVTAINGSVAKNPDQANYNQGSSVDLTAAPATGYHFVDWSGDATGSTNPLTVTMDGNKSITANFSINTYAIDASAGLGGSISPSGAVSANYGDSKQFTVSTDPGYHLVDLFVDNVHVDSTTSYTFTSVTADHTIHADFAINSYQIDASAGTGGTINPSGTVAVDHGDSKQFAISANTGYHFSDLLVDGVHVDSTTSYTFTNVTADHTIHADFAINSYQIDASAGTGGTINPSGAVAVNHGDNKQFTIVPSTGYHFADLLVDGIHVDSTTSYTFTNVTADHTIHASFAINILQIDAAASPGGSISPSGSVSVNYGSDKAFVMTPDAGYYVDSLFVDFVHVDSTTSYTFYNVTAHHTISVLFSANAPTLTSVTPDSAARGVSVDVVLVGGNFIAGVSTVNADGDISVTSITVYSIDTIYATLAIASSAVLGGHNLSVTNAAPGGGTSSAVVLNVLASLAVKDKKGRIPTEYALYQNYPNPFNPSTRIDFDLPQTSIVTLTVYNILGQEVVSLLNGEEMEMGVQTVTFSEGDLTSGIYFYRIRAEGANGKTFTSVKRMLLMK